jgi:hypothetical protein
MAVASVNVSELRRRLTDPEHIRSNAFQLVKDLCRLHSAGDGVTTAQELILRALEHRNAFGAQATVLDALVREIGLFPYLDPEELGLADQLALEAHRPASLESFVFHHPQAKVFRALMAGRSVVLSAPTSFGKSLIIDALVASQKFKNIFIVVPTLALIDETRRRLSSLRQHYKIITHGFQEPAERNVFVLTQERVLESRHLDRVDFFVIDEFYKLNPTGRDEERCALLNVAFYELAKRCRHFYLLGPGIENITEDFRDALAFDFVREDYHTVVSDLHIVRPGKHPLVRLQKLASELQDPTLVFCSSPDRTKLVADALPSDAQSRSDIQDAAEWAAKKYHADWHFVAALRRGIGIHHGRIPRSLAQFTVRAFNDGLIRFLVCTSTLIEGVNTKAKNIIVYDHKINKQPIDLFTFNNIRGRSGRMFKHYVGHVYVFHAPPETSLPHLDVPAFTQGPNAPDELLVQMDPDDLSDGAGVRVDRFRKQSVLPFEVLKANVGVDPDSQIALAEELARDPAFYSARMKWTGVPRWEELELICDFVWAYFGGAGLGSGSAKTAKQLTKLLFKLTKTPSVRALIHDQLQFTGGEPDDAVRVVLDFLRLWAMFHFPRLLRAIDRIQSAVFSASGHEYGDYDSYAALVECLFLDPALVALEEYGVPLPLARVLANRGLLRSGSGLDGLLSQLKRLAADQLAFLEPFEKAMLRDAAKYV